jgi:hypothetical protein
MLRTALVLAALALAGPALAEGKPAEDRAAAIKYYESTRDRFLAATAGLSDAQWRWKASPERWSAAEVAEHVAVAEADIRGRIEPGFAGPEASAEERKKTAGKDEIILHAVPDRSHKVSAPDRLRPTGRFATRADAVKAFEEARAKNIELLRSSPIDLRAHVFPHPVLGPVDGMQMMLFIAAHSARHTEQLEEVRKDPSFPKE